MFAFLFVEEIDKEIDELLKRLEKEEEEEEKDEEDEGPVGQQKYKLIL